MSAAAAIWRHIVSRVETVPWHQQSRSAAAMVVNSDDEPALSLIQQLFFPVGKARRRSILFAAADAPSKSFGLCEHMAIALSNASHEMVGLVERGSGAEFPPKTKKPLWAASTVPIAERVRRLSPELICSPENVSADSNGLLRGLEATFEYFVFSADVTDREMPVFSRLCDAAVLVLTAHVTRKEAALRAKEQLLRHGVTLLGTVLDQRTLPIPESIYRRL